MSNYKLKRVTVDNKCSQRLCDIAKIYGFNTIGSLHKFISQVNPNANLCIYKDLVRTSHIRKELESLEYYYSNK